MTYAREKRQLLAWLSLLMPLPLPLNDVLEWPVLFVYAGLLIFYLQRVEGGRPIVLPNWALNLLGFLYLPWLAVDLKNSLLRDQVVRALLHLLLFLLVAKLYSIKQESEKWHVLTAIFFLFVAAMSTSTHLTMTLYLVVAMGGLLYALARFAHLEVLVAAGRGAGGSGSAARSPSAAAAPLPRGRWAAAVALVLVVAICIPVFASMPRLRKPWVLGRGSGNIGLARTTGFSDSVSLDSLTSSIRESREVALRLNVVDGTPPGELRLKGAAYEVYQDQSWERPWQHFVRLDSDPDGVFTLSDAPVVGRLSISLEPLGSPSFILPVEAVALVADDLRVVGHGPGGDVASRVMTQRSKAADYEVLLAAAPVVAAHDGEDGASDPPNGLHPGGLTPRIRDLAAQVAVGEDDRARTRAVERYLLNNFTYTTRFAGRASDQPIEAFLFDRRSGHCELFATSMVLMLRAQGIPARLVAGYLGAERNDFEGLWVVRESNAHAWVEAWDGGQWRLYDPTPPDGRPAAPDRDFALLAQQLWDYVVLRFDRYVLTYGADDQESFFRKLKERVEELWNRFWPEEPDAELAPDEVPLDVPATGPGAEPGFALWQKPEIRLGGLIVFLALLALGVWWLRRPLRPDQAYARLRQGLADLDALGGAVDDASTPLDLRRRLTRDLPTTAPSAQRLIDAYVAASFAGRTPDRQAVDSLRDDLRAILSAAARRARERRKQERRKTSSGPEEANEKRAA